MASHALSQRRIGTMTPDAITATPAAETALDADRFRDLMERHGDKIYNFAWRLAGNESDARDLTQEAFARAFQHRDRFDFARPFDAWVCRILHNHFLDNVRRYEHRRSISYDAPTEGLPLTETLVGRDPNPLDALMREERDRSVQRALNLLPPLYRSAVILCDLENYSYETIAEILECPLGTVRSRLHEGRRLLRQIFAAEAAGGSR
ncbi:MAG TPA: sigma-70 family RNA polymerase sigma factor [Elusimicrobiota bacterium]|nr:sigma-70 family RNA polymerase sigma factor [Elusimicrobiota bacterium]